jgi:hypothetical protein
MEKFNLDKLIKIECKDFCESYFYTYKPEKKFLNFIIQKEGIYRQLFSKYEGLIAPENHTIKNGIIYRNPKVILYYQNDFSKTYYFNSFNEANEFYEKIAHLTSNIWIE